MDISVIIVNWNGEKWLGNCYESLRRQTYKNFEVVLVDNASQDTSVEYTRRNFPEVRILKNNTNLGYAAANNNAAYSAGGRYLFFLNNDTKLESHCLERLIRHVQNNQKIGICSVRYLGYNAERSNDEETGLGMGIDVFGYPVPSEKVFYSDGAGFFISRRLFLKLRGFDDRHFMCAEDIDLSWRAQLQGFAISFLKTAIVYHEKGATLLGSSKKGARHITSIKRRYFTERNTLRNLLKNYSLTMLFVVLLPYLILFVAEMLFFLFRGQVVVAIKVYMQALFYNAVVLYDTLEERAKVQKERTVSEGVILKKITFNKFYKWEVFKKIGIPVIKMEPHEHPMTSRRSKNTSHSSTPSASGGRWSPAKSG